MTERKTTEEFKPTRSAIAAIAAGILVIIAGFLMYNYFSRTGGEISNEAGKKEPETVKEAKEQPKLATPEEILKRPEETAKETKKIKTVKEEKWAALDHKSGDVSGNSYTVVRGDTLWEIAEGRYNNPYMWTKILNANKDKIKFLPNGNPLITPGQVLALPD